VFITDPWGTYMELNEGFADVSNESETERKFAYPLFSRSLDSYCKLKLIVTVVMTSTGSPFNNVGL
jgi:hypothetical protein